jgi:hypothetical protein
VRETRILSTLVEVQKELGKWRNLMSTVFYFLYFDESTTRQGFMESCQISNESTALS